MEECYAAALITRPTMLREPSLRFSQAIWWDTLLAFYGPNRQESANEIFFDLTELFRTSPASFSFINLPLFYAVLHDPEARPYMQPSLILACLSLSVFMRSNEMELGHKGRVKAMKLQEYAQASFAASYNS